MGVLKCNAWDHPAQSPPYSEGDDCPTLLVSGDKCPGTLWESGSQEGDRESEDDG